MRLRTIVPAKQVSKRFQKGYCKDMHYANYICIERIHFIIRYVSDELSQHCYFWSILVFLLWSFLKYFWIVNDGHDMTN